MLTLLVPELAATPPPTVMLVPGDSNGDFVMMFITPLGVFGPYSAAPGPRTTSIRSMSSFVIGTRYGTLTASDGTDANRLSVSVISAPENILLNPRATTFDWTRPPLETSMPGNVLI